MVTDEDIKNLIPSNNNTVFSLQKKIFSRSNLSLLVINRENKKEYGFVDPNERYNRLIGVDYNLASKDNKYVGKFYFHKSLRGKGLGKYLMKLCLDFAVKVKYDLCYLESTSALKTSHHLYKIFGFENIQGPMGNTSHHNCDVHMTKKLQWHYKILI